MKFEGHIKYEHIYIMLMGHPSIYEAYVLKIIGSFLDDFSLTQVLEHVCYSHV